MYPSSFVENYLLMLIGDVRVIPWCDTASDQEGEETLYFGHNP
jgi:hypothetical protein